jgi:hypothetical protein
MKRAGLLCLGVFLASCSRGTQPQPTPAQRPVSPPLAIQWSAPEVIGPLPSGLDRFTRISAAKVEQPQVVWVDFSGQTEREASPLMWCERTGAGWSEPRALSTQASVSMRHLFFVSDATGESIVAWMQTAPPGWVMCYRQQGEWSAPSPAGFQGFLASAHVLGQPGHFGLFYSEVVQGRLARSRNAKLLFRSLEGGQLGPPVVVADKGILGGNRAFARAANGDVVLAFFAWRTSFFRGTGPPELYLASMRAGEGGWGEPVRLLEGLDPDNNSATAKAPVWSASVWAESADDICVAYDLVLGVDSTSDAYVATWTKGGKATVHRLQGWPVRPTPRDERVLRLAGLPDGSLIILYATGSYLEVAHCWNGEVLATSQEQFPGKILGMDIDSEGRLHVVGTSEDALWYKRGTPGWTGH